jgi:hypothetical protein
MADLRCDLISLRQLGFYESPLNVVSIERKMDRMLTEELDYEKSQKTIGANISRKSASTDIIATNQS